jgi:hypothetical protein
MKKYILIAFVISLMFVAISSYAFMITRDSLDHVEIVMAMKGEVCNIENPGCDEPQGDEPIEENTTTALPWGERFDLSAACLRQKMDELDCQGEAKDMIFGQFATFMKNGTEGGKFWSSDIVVIINDNVYGPQMMTAGYWRANDTYKTINFSAGGHYAYMPGEAEHPYKFMGLKYLAFSQPHRFDPDIQPYGSERVNPGFILIYYDEDGTLNIYAHLKENYYKMTAIKKKVENKTWTPPPEPETPENQNEVEIPRKIDVPTPIPPPPIYLPGMPETADPKKEHVIPNCNSQGASVCRQDEECPDKWIKAKEDRCCSVICTPVGKKEVPPGLEKKNETKEEKSALINTTLALAAELGLPEGYNAEFLLKPDLLSPLIITATSDDQLLVAEHYGHRLLRIDPLTAKIEILYNLPHGGWSGLLSDGSDGAYLSIEGKLAHIDKDGNYSVYSNYDMTPAALSSNNEIYGFTKSDVLVLQGKNKKPKTIASGFSMIYDLVRDKEGNLYVSDWDLGTITRIKPDGTKQLIISGLNQKDPLELGFAPDGTLYISEGAGRFSQVDIDNSTLKKINWFSFTEGVHPTDFTFLSNGKAYFVDPTHNSILSADFQKEEVEIIIKGGYNSRALDVGSDDAVYIGDTTGYPIYRSRILRIQLNGSVEVYADDLDAITDLSFAQNGNMFVTTRRFGENDTTHVLLITPNREVKNLVSWGDSSEMRSLWSISVNPKTGLAVAYDQSSNKLISIDENGSVIELPSSFDFETNHFVYLDHSANGTLYATETSKEGWESGPFVEKNLIMFDEDGNPKIITDFNHIGCCTTENLVIAPDGAIYVLGYKLESNDMCLWSVTNDGEKILLTDKLPIDPLSVGADGEGNIYVACSAGLLRIWK